jgi:hypothetical protein
MLGLGRTWLIVVAVVVGVGGLAAYLMLRPPPDVVGKGDGETVAWIGLATGIVGFLTALVGLIEKLVERRRPDGE